MNSPEKDYKERDEFEIGDFIYATWDTEPHEVIKKDGTDYMIYRDGFPRWLGFEDVLSEAEAREKFPDNNIYDTTK